jgi:hypothetical protein
VPLPLNPTLPNAALSEPFRRLLMFRRLAIAGREHRFRARFVISPIDRERRARTGLPKQALRRADCQKPSYSGRGHWIIFGQRQLPILGSDGKEESVNWHLNRVRRGCDCMIWRGLAENPRVVLAHRNGSMIDDFLASGLIERVASRNRVIVSTGQFRSQRTPRSRAPPWGTYPPLTEGGSWQSPSHRTGPSATN